MAEISLEDVDNLLSQWCNRARCEIDNHGQLVYYTGIYRWNSDNAYHNEPEPEELLTREAELDELLKPGG